MIWPLVALQAGILAGFVFGLLFTTVNWKNRPPTLRGVAGMFVMLGTFCAMPMILANFISLAIAAAAGWVMPAMFLPVFALVPTFLMLCWFAAMDKGMRQVGGLRMQIPLGSRCVRSTPRAFGSTLSI